MDTPWCVWWGESRRGCPTGPGLPQQGEMMGRQRGRGERSPSQELPRQDQGKTGKRGWKGGELPPQTLSPPSSCLYFFCEWAAAPLLRGEVPVSLTFAGEQRSLLTSFALLIVSLLPDLDGSLFAQEKDLKRREKNSNNNKMGVGGWKSYPRETALRSGPAGSAFEH